MSENNKQDLIVIGAGPGGYVAAIRAAQIGMTVRIIEKETIGGTCLNVGCIPTKALYANAGTVNTFRNSAYHGIISSGFELDMKAVLRNKKKIVKQFTLGVKSLLKANKVKTVIGTAKFFGLSELEVETAEGRIERHTADHIIIATGSKSAALPANGADLDVVINSTGALELETVPEHMLVVGAGVIGIELAGIYRSFGSKVTVIEFMPNILPNMDHEVASKLQKEMEKAGIRFFLDSKVVSIEKKDGRAAAKIESGGQTFEETCDVVLNATGRLPNIDGLNLEALGIQHDRQGFIAVDENYETSVKGVYAIGDVIPGFMLAHVASAEGIVAVERINGQDSEVDMNLIPQSVFSFPEFSSIGKTEEELIAQNIDYIASRSYFRGNGKALTMHDAEGIIKVLASPDLQTILGVHILGPHANDLIAESAAAMYSMLTIEEYASIMRGHPTLSEALAEAVENFLGTAIHVPPQRKK
ncbi:MAG TPA: dihydrolipoyl dehydrogenase [Oscillospiraceae bacterium]|nr:dihydrolipoyl dehydrogenase [Oscillospiraceae bacterium]